jgi:hypothetical protein
MSQWYEVEWPPTEQHPSLPNALYIVQSYLSRSRGPIQRDDVAFACSVMLTHYRRGETRHLMLANKAIGALEERDAKRTVEHPGIMHLVS